jgi:hypothetical protein
MKIKLKDNHFETIEVIDAESQVVLDNLREHDFQDAFKKIAKALETVYTCGKGLLQG